VTGESAAQDMLKVAAI